MTPVLGRLVLGPALLVGACQPPPPPAAAASQVDCFEEGEAILANRDFGAAAKTLEACLADSPDSPRRPRALLQLAVARMLGDSSRRSRQGASALLRRLVDESEQDPAALAGAALLQLLTEVTALRASTERHKQQAEALRHELDKLKRVDLEIKPARPID